MRTENVRVTGNLSYKNKHFLSLSHTHTLAKMTGRVPHFFCSPKCKLQTSFIQLYLKGKLTWSFETLLEPETRNHHRVLSPSLPHPIPAKQTSVFSAHPGRYVHSLWMSLPPCLNPSLHLSRPNYHTTHLPPPSHPAYQEPPKQTCCCRARE